MILISDESAKKIGALALCFTNEDEFNKYYDTLHGGSTIFRDFKHRDLLCSIMFKEKNTDIKKGIHLNIMKNGDVFARQYPYYDGSLEVIAVFNQREIFEVAEEFIKKNIK